MGIHRAFILKDAVIPSVSPIHSSFIEKVGLESALTHCQVLLMASIVGGLGISLLRYCRISRLNAVLYV